MKSFDDIKAYGSVSLSDLFKHIHKNNKDLDKQINAIINIVSPHITNPGSISMLLPVIKDLLEVNVKNHDQLVKMAAVVQRAAATNPADEDSLFNLDEISKLVEEHHQIQDAGSKLLEDSVTQITQLTQNDKVLIPAKGNQTNP